MPPNSYWIFPPLEAYAEGLVYDKWEKGHDSLMGPYRQRLIRGARGTCFACGHFIKDEDAYERERGNTRWLLCAPSDRNGERGCA